MLYSLDRFEQVTTIPHRREFDLWTGRLSKSELTAIKTELKQRIAGSEIHTSSWMPGSNWIGTVFQPIWEKACLKNVDTAAMCFGLILWSVMKDHEDWWSFGRYKLNEVPIKGLTYFRIENPFG